MAADLTAATADDRVLDVATGTGFVLRFLPAASAHGQRIGVDISAGMLKMAHRVLPMATFVVADAADVPFECGRFDAVTCVAAIPYLGAVNLAFEEWHRVLRPGGQLVLTVVRDGGLTSFALLRGAAHKAGIELTEPNAGSVTNPRWKPSDTSTASLSRRSSSRDLTNR